MLFMEKKKKYKTFFFFLFPWYFIRYIQIEKKKSLVCRLPVVYKLEVNSIAIFPYDYASQTVMKISRDGDDLILHPTGIVSSFQERP